MAEYLSPGVYVEEFDSGAKAMEGVGTSTAGFVGLAEKGPTIGTPVLLTSFADYKRRFGGYLSELTYGGYRYLPNCVEQFFSNGGTTCYVMRVAPETAHAASSKKEESSDQNDPITVTALDPGSWANTMVAVLSPSIRAKTQIMESREGNGGNQYRLKKPAGFRPGDIVGLQENGQTTYNKITSVNGEWVTISGTITADAVDTELVPQKVLVACGIDLLLSWDNQQETYSGCSINPEASDYLPAMMEKSTLAKVELNIDDSNINEPFVLLGGGAEDKDSGDKKRVLRIELGGGTDGTKDDVDAGVFMGSDDGPGKRKGLEAFKDISDVSIMAVPGVTDASVQAKLIEHCENLASRFAVLDAPMDCTSVEDLNNHKETYDTSYAALYAPWIKVYDQQLKRPVFLPPSGSVCGVYARTDTERGVHKAPANEVIKGCTGLYVSYNEAEQGKLNPNGINLIRALPRQGIRVWGARTCSSDGNWKYINVRRLFIFLEESIKKNTGWVVFEPNDEGLWSRVKSTISLFLETQRRNGALMGSTADEAYYVDVGNNTMSQDDILNGRLICEIGVAPVRPAEFVIFRITQMMQDAT